MSVAKILGICTIVATLLIASATNVHAVMNLYASSQAMQGFTPDNEGHWSEGLAALGQGQFQLAKEHWTAASETSTMQLKGYFLAELGLSVIYEYGLGTAPDQTEASEYWRRAFEERSTIGQAQRLELTLGQVHALVGAAFLEGRGVAVDHERAWTHFIFGSSHGNAYSHFRMGQMYEEGTGLTGPDAPSAFRNYMVAARQGLPDAQLALGEMYKKGVGAPQNFQWSYTWYSIAASMLTGDKAAMAIVGRDDAAERLTPGALERGQAVALRCVETDFEDCNQ